MVTMRLPVLFCGLFLPLAAHAACDGETYLDCTVENGRQLQVCIGADAFTYRFGPAEAPELELSVPIAEGTATPWPGVGGAIWSYIGFPVDGHVYEVWTSIDRNDADDAPPPSGGVNVLKGDETVAALTCQSGTVSPAFTLEDALDARGWCWNYDSLEWLRKPACG